MGELASDELSISISSTGVLTFHRAGEVEIRALKSGDSEYSAASASFTLTILRASQSSFALSSTYRVTYGVFPFVLDTVNALSVGVLSWESDASGVACVDAVTGLIEILRGGEVTLSGDDCYESAYAECLLTVDRSSQSAFHIVGAGVVKSVGIPNTSHVEYDYTLGEALLGIEGGSVVDGEVTWSVSDASIIEVFPAAGSSFAELPSVSEVTAGVVPSAELSSVDESSAGIVSTGSVVSPMGLVRLNHTGSTILCAELCGDDRYEPVESYCNISIVGSMLRITSLVVSKSYGDAPFSLEVTGTDGLPLRWSSNASSVASIDPVSGLITIHLPDEATLTASLTDPVTNREYTASHTLSISRCEISVSGGVIASKVYDGSRSAIVSSLTFANVLPSAPITSSDYLITFSVYADPSVGANKEVSLTLFLTGVASERYVLSSSTFYPPHRLFFLLV